jgi:hypothetical protein
MEMSGKLRAPIALPPEKNKHSHFIGSMRPCTGLNILGKRETSYRYRDPNPVPPSP